MIALEPKFVDERICKELRGFLDGTSVRAEEAALTQSGGDERLYAVLQVSAGCSMDELKHAYLQQAALWHPDKVDHLAPELKAHAEHQMKLINEAYASLRSQNN